MSRAGKKVSTPGLAIGATPRIDLLPPEVRIRMRNRSIRRGLGLFVVAVVVAVGAGTALATLNAGVSAGSLAAEQQRTQDLLVQQLEFVEVTQLANAKSGIEQALLVGSSTEIMWPAYIVAVAGTLPEGTSIASLNVVASSPIALVAQPALPLQVPRVATIVLAVNAPDLATVSAWIARLPGLPGFADATLNSIDPAEGGVVAHVTVNVTDEAFANRFAATEEGES